MKKALTKSTTKIWHVVDGCIIEGLPSHLHGDVTGLWGDVTGLWGNVTDLWGNVTGLSGDVRGLWGDVSGLWGDVDACQLTPAERKAGVNVKDLIDEN